MKLSGITAVLLFLVVVPAYAGDGNVPRSTLAKLGLSDMQVLSDAEGMQVRGSSSSSRATSFSVFSITIFDPVTPTVFMFSGVDSPMSVTDSGPGLNAPSGAALVSTAPFAGFVYGVVGFSVTIGAFSVSGSAMASSP